MSHRKTAGMYGEKAALYFLSQKGHVVIGRNIRTKLGEIDLLSLKDGVLYINEVKTSISRSSVLPEFNLNFAKMNKLKMLAIELEQACYTRNSFMNNIVGFRNMRNIKDIGVNGVCVYVTLIHYEKGLSEGNISRITVKFFNDLFTV